MVYDSPSATVRELWWKYLREIASSCQFPRLVMGDFNDVSSLVEKLGGRFCFRKAEIFAESIDACDLLDIGFLGSPFTWHRKHGNSMVWLLFLKEQ